LISGKPGRSGAPVIQGVGSTSVTMTWTVPKTDGGEKVRAYTIVAAEKGSNKWRVMNPRTPCTETYYTGTFLVLYFIRSPQLWVAWWCSGDSMMTDRQL